MIRFFCGIQKQELTCKEAAKLVIPYIQGQLNDTQLDRFTRHVQECSDCREELETYYIVYKGLMQLEEKEELPTNMIEALNEDLNASKQHLRNMSVFYWFSEILKWLVNALCFVFMFLKIIEWVIGI